MYKILVMRHHILILFVFFCLLACKSQRPLVSKDAVCSSSSSDSLRYQHNLRRDSIFIRDSIFVTERQKNDTVYITKNKYKTIYRDREVVKIDTLAVVKMHTDTIIRERTEQVRYVPGFYKTCTWLLGLLMVVLVGIAAVKAYTFFRRL